MLAKEYGRGSGPERAGCVPGLPCCASSACLYLYRNAICETYWRPAVGSGGLDVRAYPAVVLIVHAMVM
jgi:hypothetical protein